MATFKFVGLKNFIRVVGFVVFLFLINSALIGQDSGTAMQKKSDVEVVDSLNALSAYYRTLNLDSMNVYAEKAYTIANKTGYVSGKIEAVQRISTKLILSGDFTNAIDFLFREKLSLDTLRYSRENAIVDYTIGVAYNASQNFKAGLPYLNEALERFRTVQDSIYFLRCLNNIGVGYIRLKQFEQALTIFKELVMYEDTLEIGIRTTTLINLVYCYYGLEDYASARQTLKHFFELPKSEIDERGYGFAYFKQGEIFEKEGDLQAALSSFKASIKVFEKFKTEPNKIEVYNGMARLFLSQKDYANALNYVNKGLSIATKRNILLYENLVLETKYKILEDQGKFKEALDVFEKYKSVSDSLVETQQSAEMGRIIAQYEFNQQRNLLQLKQKQLELENQEALNEKQTTINISIIIIAAIAVLLAAIYRSYTLKIKRNKLLTQKNKEIELQRDQLDEANKIKNKLISIIGHDLRSPINTLNGLLQLVRNKMVKKEDLETALPKLIENFDHTSSLLNNLLNWTTSQMEGYTLELIDFNIKSVLAKVVEDAKFQLEEKSVKCKIEGDSVKVRAEENMIIIVCQNLLNNAIKFCRAGDTIEVNIKKLDNVLVSIIDSGMGISEETVTALLTENTFTSTKGTNNEKGSGLGLTICKDFLKRNNSELKIESSENKGSTFYFYLQKSEIEE